MVKPSLQPGTLVDGFRIEDCVHRGGMATLWRVSRDDIALPLVMKIPTISEGQDPATIVSFEMEQMIMPRLSGVHVPRFIAAGDFAVQPYIVMERIPGATLYQRLPALPLAYAEVAELGARISLALDDLHRQHVIHLDIKPSNIMFRPSGEAVLLDYGLSHHNQLPDLMKEEFRLPYGTAPYMSPEQLLGIRSDARSDLFALGVLVYFFSTGIRPFGESETMRGMRRRLWRDPVPPRRIKPDDRLTAHALEAIDPASAILEFARTNRVDHILIGARHDSLLRDLLGSVSAKVAAGASCTVTVVRPAAREAAAAARPDRETGEASRALQRYRNRPS